MIERAVTVHQVHSPEIAIDGDAATGVWALHDRVILKPGLNLTGYGHYIETYRKQDGRWRITTSTIMRLHVDLA